MYNSCILLDIRNVSCSLGMFRVILNFDCSMTVNSGCHAVLQSGMRQERHFKCKFSTRPNNFDLSLQKASRTSSYKIVLDDVTLRSFPSVMTIIPKLHEYLTLNSSTMPLSLFNSLTLFSRSITDISVSPKVRYSRSAVWAKMY